MDGFGRRRAWAVAGMAVLLSVVVGFVAYNIGLSHGIAESAIAAGDGVPEYWRHRPWGFGFAFPLLFVFFWIFVMKAFFWGWGGPWRYRHFHPGWYGGLSSFDDWHRRAHDRMRENPPGNDPDRRG